MKGFTDVDNTALISFSFLTPGQKAGKFLFIYQDILSRLIACISFVRQKATAIIFVLSST